MGGSDGGEGGSIVDCSVGTIVWVRRRNGSWWPGRILGPEELSASHLMSPRSGTPVKLLGREDASVDWYNLEKSKRVKAFRCGEFDACIERAEASQGIPIKKREKYARREDAILHALELEKQQLGMKHQKLGTISNGSSHRSSGAHRRELHSFSSDIYMRDDESKLHSKYANKSYTFPRKAVLSGEEENMSNSLYVHKGKASKRSGWEEYNDDSLPRMRGLQDFGLRIAPPKKKFSQCVTWEASHKPVDPYADNISNMGDMMIDKRHTGSSKSSSAIKRKRTQGGNDEDSIVKKRDRRRPLHQVLQSSAKLPASHSFHSDTTTQLGTSNHLDYPGTWAEEYSSSGLAEETESDSSETDYLEPDPGEEGNLTDTTQTQLPQPKDCEPSVLQVSEDYRDLDSIEVPPLDYTPHLRLQDQMIDASADAGVSKWNMKGKRNIRNLPKRHMDLMDAKVSGHADEHNGLGTSFKMRTNSSGHRAAGQSFHHKKESSHFAPDGDDMLEEDLDYGNRRYPFALQGVKDHGSFNDSDNDSHLLSPTSWRADGPSSHMARRGAFWEESDEEFGPNYADRFSYEMESMIVDVDIQVQKRSYQGEHVPWVSLSSKGNGGKPILGHPVQIEILEDGSSGHLVSRYDFGVEESSIPPAFRRTAKRTVMHRMPRSHPATSAFEEDADQLDSDQDIRPPLKKAYTNYFKKRNSNARRPTMPVKSQKKPVKKANISNQKTRTLSSLATDMKNFKRSDILDGLIKPEEGIPLVTCVPVKVVFSRILEAVGRPSSVFPHRARLNSPAVRGLS
ncbi:uncharacterized protein A4U43_C04F9270 [Asparagus officinalis]|uniref:PWWP domain-containing protein n=1 Tax=Asparagus officinalis TaxID=4686 RepID=A0A5P1EZG2_ASPOF|nr:uncharacterized protein A4U43_C04F9270 [Asparagus officinalis]